jgi:K+-sensing histidine kinase KdpD
MKNNSPQGTTRRKEACMKVHAETTPEDIASLGSKRVAVRNTAIGSAICTAAAVIVTLLLRNVHDTDSLPLLFLIVVGLVAHRFGTSSGILGLVIGGCVFATFLFPPIGHIAIAGESARTNLVMMLLFGLAIAYFYGTGKSDENDPGDQKN